MADLNVDFDRNTGRILRGWDAVAQAVAEIIRTAKGQRVFREALGTLAQPSIGQPISNPMLLRLVQSIGEAVTRYEPRFLVKNITRAPRRDGVVALFITGDYRPSALSGDLSVEGEKVLEIAA